MSSLCELYSHMLGQRNAFVILITLNISLIRQMFIFKICSDCINIVARYIIRQLDSHQQDSQCPLGHKLQ